MRYGFTIDGIICEYAEVWFNGAMVESACVESENYDGDEAGDRGAGPRGDAEHQLPEGGQGGRSA